MVIPPVRRSKKNRNWLGAWLVLCALMMIGCTGGGGAVVFAPTPLPADLSPITYTHPDGAFRIRVPRTWSVYTQDTSTLASASFTPPNGTMPQITATAAKIDFSGTLLDFINRYQVELRPDAPRYSEQDRQQMDDGSWRLSGLRETAGGLPEQVNTFVLHDGEMIGVLDVVIPTNSEAQWSDLEQIANTFSINADAELEATDLATLTAAAQADLDVRDVSAWWTPAGVFFITGEVLNHSGTVLTDITLVASLFDASGNTVAEANDHVMGYALPPGEFAPFSLRFDQPLNAMRYTLTLDGGVAYDGEIIGGEDLTWTNESSRNDDGRLIITGEVTNTGNRTARNPLLTITVFDDAGDVIAAGFTPLDMDRLAPEDSVSYAIQVPEIGGEPANFYVNVQAQR